jgi:hypothetical protein
MSVNKTYSPLSKGLVVNRRAVIFVLMILTVSLISLGVRLPTLSGVSSNSGKPKPRPRAVIQNQIKTCKQIVTSFADAVAVLPGTGFKVEIPQTEKLKSLSHINTCFCIFITANPSRASPTYSTPV